MSAIRLGLFLDSETPSGQVGVFGCFWGFLVPFAGALFSLVPFRWVFFVFAVLFAPVACWARGHQVGPTLCVGAASRTRVEK